MEQQPASDVEQLASSLGELPEAVAWPALVMVSGLPGTGKSYFCRQLAERLPFVVLESDALRRALFPSPGYSPEESHRLFKAVHLLIKKLLKKGISIILDATNLSERYREHIYSITEHLGVKLVLVRVEAPPEVVRQRLGVRVRDAESKSSAGWEVYQKMRPTADRIRRQHFAVDTSRDIAPVVDKVVRKVARQ